MKTIPVRYFKMINFKTLLSFFCLLIIVNSSFAQLNLTGFRILIQIQPGYHPISQYPLLQHISFIQLRKEEKTLLEVL